MAIAIFRNTSKFNQPLDWDTSQVTDMAKMFQYAWAYNQYIQFDYSLAGTLETSVWEDATSMSKCNKKLTYDYAGAQSSGTNPMAANYASWATIADDVVPQAFLTNAEFKTAVDDWM